MGATGPAPTPTFNVKVWDDFCRQPGLTISKRRLFGTGTKIFTMGSCFAGEIRRAMKARGFAVYPDYVSVDFDKSTQVFDKIPERDCIAHYDTFVIRQEFEAALGVWKDRSAGFLEVQNSLVNKVLNAEVVYQEPSRKLVYARTFAQLEDLDAKIDTAVREGIEQSDIIIITLGLTEVWQHTKTGRYFCRPPGTGYGGGVGAAVFRQSTFTENYANVRATFDLLFSRFPKKQVILTVSPVPLAMTYSATDIGTANLESKSILRAVAGQICREYASNVTYFPSYEMATIMPWPVFQEDKRHVLPEFAERVVGTFQSAFG